MALSDEWLQLFTKMKTLPCLPLRNNNWINWFIDQTQLIGFFQKIKIDQKFLSIDFDSWSKLSGLLMADRKLVQRIQVPHATAERQ